jgi:hypothetical protein
MPPIFRQAIDPACKGMRPPRIGVPARYQFKDAKGV